MTCPSWDPSPHLKIAVVRRDVLDSWGSQLERVCTIGTQKIHGIEFVFPGILFLRCEKTMPPPGRFHFQVSLRRTGSWTKDRPGQIDNSFLLEVRKDSTKPAESFPQLRVQQCRKEPPMASRKPWTSSTTIESFRRIACCKKCRLLECDGTS